MTTALLASLVMSVSLVGPRFNVFPMPTSVVDKGSDWTLRAVHVDAPACLTGEADQLRGLLAAAGVRSSSSGEAFKLVVNPRMSETGSEGYRLEIRAGHGEIVGSTSAGVYHGIQTVGQLLRKEGKSVILPCGTIVDKPRFQWRGMMLDTSRHFFPKADVLRLLDSLARYKFNRFHWHLNDDGGWRIEIKKYPELTRRGAWRIPKDGRFPEYTDLDFPPAGSEQGLYGGYYSQEDVREIVRYAESRHIEIVPEIEMPGHNLAATLSYPWLVCSPKLKEAFQKDSSFVFPNIYCPSKETTYRFCQDVLDEVMALFPGKVIHIGGDEVDKFLWTRCDDCLSLMKAKGINPAQLESYFIQRIEKYLNAHGREIIGWDEILEGGLAPNAKVMSWRGTVGGEEAAKLGHDVVMTPWDWCYFDHHNDELTIPMVLGYDPSPAKDATVLGSHVLGAQACVWTETIPTYKELEDRLFPRLLAMSQILWSKRKEPLDQFLDRLDQHAGVLYQLASGMHVNAPRTPVDVVAPGASVPFALPDIAGAELVADTGSGWKAVRGALALGAGGSALVAVRLPDGRIGDSLTLRAGVFRPITVEAPKSGLVSALYIGSFRQVPNFETLTPVEKREGVGVALPDRIKENYALKLSGLLKISKAGIYRLSVGSDDGSWLALQGVKILDNDGPHGLIVKSARVALRPGYYPLAIGYFQGTEGAKLQATIEGPDLPEQAIPATMLWH